VKKISRISIYKLLLLLFCAGWFGISMWLVASAWRHPVVRFDTGRIVVPATINDPLIRNTQVDVIREFKKCVDSLLKVWPELADSITTFEKKYLHQLKK
jgi:hypothetical protein